VCATMQYPLVDLSNTLQIMSLLETLTNLEEARSQHSQECQNPRQHCFLYLVTKILDLLTPKSMGFKDARRNISMSSW